MTLSPPELRDLARQHDVPEHFAAVRCKVYRLSLDQDGVPISTVLPHDSPRRETLVVTYEIRGKAAYDGTVALHGDGVRISHWFPASYLRHADLAERVRMALRPLPEERERRREEAQRDDILAHLKPNVMRDIMKTTPIRDPVSPSPVRGTLRKITVAEGQYDGGDYHFTTKVQRWSGERWEDL